MVLFDLILSQYFISDEDEVDELERDYGIQINDGRCIVSLWEDRNLSIGNMLAPTQSLLAKMVERRVLKLRLKLALKKEEVIKVGII